MAELKAGAARADMTPPLGIPLAGFWAPRPAEGIDTPLAAHALLLDDGSRRLAFVAVDLIALLAEQVDQAKAEIRRRCGIDAQSVLVACSHTHEGPYPCGLLGKDTGADPAYLARVVHAIVESVTRAAESIEPAEISVGSTLAEGICRNRRCLKDGDGFNFWQLPAAEHDKWPPAGPVDEELLVLAVRRATGRPLAVLWNYTLHAHAFAEARVNADFPYYVGRKLAAALGEEVVSVFTAGACADINRILDVAGPAIVDRLADSLLGLYEAASFSPRARLAAATEAVEAPLRDFTVFQEDEIRRKQPANLEVCREEWEILRRLDQRSASTVLQVLAVDDFAVAAVPGEYFCALGLDVKRRSPFAHTAVAELGNDYIGYIPTSAAYDEGGYELFNARSAKVARGVGEEMAETLVRMLNGLHGP